jgi:hypothetical protein
MSATVAPDMRWLPMAQAAQALGISPRTMQRRVLDGQVPAKGVGRHRVYLVAMADQEPVSHHGGAAGSAAAMSAVVATLGATAAETRALAQTTLDDLGLWREQAARDRRSAARAWTVAAAVAAGLVAAVVAWRSEVAQRERSDQEAERARADADQARAHAGEALAILGGLRSMLVVDDDPLPDATPDPIEPDQATSPSEPEGSAGAISAAPTAQ